MLLFAGEDMTSHLTARLMHQLAKHPQLQSKLRKEVVSARREHNGSDFDYDTLMSLPYLDAICRETVRVFPPLVLLPRVYVLLSSFFLASTEFNSFFISARKDTVLPLSWPISTSDGKTQINEIPIKKGQRVMVSILGANHSTRIWGEDAEQWKPERWLNAKLTEVATEQLPGVYHSTYVLKA